MIFLAWVLLVVYSLVTLITIVRDDVSPVAKLVSLAILAGTLAQSAHVVGLF